METEKEIKKQLNFLLKGITQMISCEVVSVDKNKKTIIVKDADNLDLPVRLSATVDDKKKSVFYPKVGSSVLVSCIGNDETELVVVAFSEVEEMSIEIGDLRFEMNVEGYLLKKQNETLQKILLDLITLIKTLKFQVTTPDTINGTTTLLLTDFTSIETRIKDFLKAN